MSLATVRSGSRGASIPDPRPVLWPLRPLSSAEVSDELLATGQRRIRIVHAPLRNVTPEMLGWWYGGNIVGTMRYAGRLWPRYLVWHPLDHISYEVLDAAAGGAVAPGSRIRVREAFQRDPANLLDVTVEVERIDAEAAVIARRTAGGPVLRLTNRFTPIASGTAYESVMEIGMPSLLGRVGANRVIRRRVLSGRRALAWARHHVEEVGNLEHFLPGLWEGQEERA